mgnify:CR=1 FL=1
MPSITMELVKMSKKKKAQLVKEVTDFPYYRTAPAGHLCIHQRERTGECRRRRCSFA